VVVVAQLSDGKAPNKPRGRGECVPYARYGESVESVSAAIEAMRPQLAGGLDRAGLQIAMPPGAARNALDCAFWDCASAPAAGYAAGPRPAAARHRLHHLARHRGDRGGGAASARRLLKIKLGQVGDPARIAAVRAAAPQSELIVDANEGWSGNAENLAACARVASFCSSSRCRRACRALSTRGRFGLRRRERS
jgi:L-alanine-DL-glutamate epimerase-like enolase superfamily enzyme